MGIEVEDFVGVIKMGEKGGGVELKGRGSVLKSRETGCGVRSQTSLRTRKVDVQSLRW